MDNFDREAGLQELATLKRIIDGYILTSQVLNGMELDTLMIKPSAMKEVFFADESSTVGDIKSCKICRDDRGRPYCYYGSNGCP